MLKFNVSHLLQMMCNNFSQYYVGVGQHLIAVIVLNTVVEAFLDMMYLLAQLHNYT